MPVNSMSSKERVFAILKGEETDRSAVINPTSIATLESCELLGMNFNNVHLCADQMAALAAYGYEKLGFDSVMPYFSVVQEARAFGCTIDWGTGYSMPDVKK